MFTGVAYNRLDITTKVFGKLTAVEYAFTKNTRSYWKCRCECGKEKVIETASLRSGLTKSCGCYRPSTKGKVNVKHGMHGTKTYRIWRGMWTRCTNPKCPQFDDYAGRGIRVCDRWRKFEEFLKDVGVCPGELYSLDRYPNNDGNYEPDNVRWATDSQQNRNTRANRIITINGVTKCAADWLDDPACKVNGTTLYKRIENGWDFIEAVTIPKYGRATKRRTELLDEAKEAA